MPMLLNTFSFRVKIGNITPKERTQHVPIIISVSYSYRIYERSHTRRSTEVCDSHERENWLRHFRNFHSTFIYVWIFCLRILTAIFLLHILTAMFLHRILTAMFRLGIHTAMFLHRSIYGTVLTPLNISSCSYAVKHIVLFLRW